jgi:hypothetical protein
MIRWYDYIVAILAADVMMTFMFAGFNSTTWWEPVFFGLIAGFVFRIWEKNYCRFRLKQENK